MKAVILKQKQMLESNCEANIIAMQDNIITLTRLPKQIITNIRALSI